MIKIFDKRVNIVIKGLLNNIRKDRKSAEKLKKKRVGWRVENQLDRVYHMIENAHNGGRNYFIIRDIPTNDIVNIAGLIFAPKDGHNFTRLLCNRLSKLGMESVVSKDDEKEDKYMLMVKF